MITQLCGVTSVKVDGSIPIFWLRHHLYPQGHSDGHCRAQEPQSGEFPHVPQSMSLGIDPTNDELPVGFPTNKSPKGVPSENDMP